MEDYHRNVHTCPSCNSPLPERGNFCPTCAAQARCKVCRELLEPNAAACVECGALAVASGSAGTANEQYSSSSRVGESVMNILQYNEDTKSRSLRVSLTNQAAESFSDALGMFIAGRNEKSAFPTRRRSVIDHPTLPGIGESATVEILEQTSGTTVETSPKNSDQERLRTIFRYKDDVLELEEPRLKVDNKLEYARRLTYLFLYAHELEGRDQVARASLVKVLNDAKVYDTNTMKWLRTTSALKIENDNFHLNKEGKDNAVTALNQALDASILNTWTPESSAIRSSKSTPTSTSQKAKPTGKRTTVNIKDIVSKYKAQYASNTEIHNKLNPLRAYEKGLFALWAMAEFGGESFNIVSPYSLAKFLLDALVIQVDVRGLGRALEKPEAKGKIIKVGAGYQLQPPGTAHIQQLLGLDKKTKPR